MCGIIGIVSLSGFIAPDLVKGLKFLEYRGYDSAGVATIKDNIIYLEKDKGKVDDIEARLGLSRLPGSIGIAHTRWATHGAPEKINAHPHTDCDNKIAVVHNGIIDNFNDIKQRLIKGGHTFKSLTDTEVVPHLIEEYVKSGLDYLDAVFHAVKELEGSYAFGIISTYEPGLLVCAKKESPLILGVGNNTMYCASDVSSLMPFTNRVVVLDDGEIAVITPNDYKIYRLPELTVKVKQPITVDIKVENATKGDFSHYMLKEIFEQPIALSYSIRLQEHYLSLMADLLDRSGDIYIVAAGTSYHAGLVGNYILSRIARLVTIPVIASEFIARYGDSIGVDSTLLAISQSGETIDVLKAIEFAKSRAATILGITNVLASSLTRVSRVYIHQQSGPEIGVAATKTFTGQLAVLYQLALISGKRRGKLSQREMDDLMEDIAMIPSLVKETLNKTDSAIKDLAKRYCKKNYFIFLGRGISYPIALEARLKLLEISYIPSLAYPAGESKHGPISLIEEGVPTVFIAPPDDTRRHIISNIEEMRARGATIITLGDENDEELKELSSEYIELPQVNPLLSPIPYVVPLQLFAYYTAILLGRNPDRPRNLAKSVTVL